MTDTPPPAGNAKQSQEMTFWDGMKLTFELGYILAIPAVIFGIAGEYLDSYLHIPDHILLITLLVIALSLSVMTIAKKLKKLTSEAAASPLSHDPH